MARVTKGSLLQGLSGTLGKEVVFKQYADKVVVSRYPDMSKVKTTPRQAAQRSLLAEANAYAGRAKRDPALRAYYEKDLQPGESVFHKAKRDFFERLKKGG
ncbi:MAG: hypothetical protein ACTHMD_10575 [Flavisolibacter sp.]